MSRTVHTSPRILVVTDQRVDAAAIVEDLRGEFAHVHASTDPERAAADFADHTPDVVLLAFDGLAKASTYCRALDGWKAAWPQVVYRTIILCNRAECAEVVALCKQEHFDDYVLYWPQPYDGFRLAMSIRNAGREVALVKAIRSGPVDLLGQARHVEELDRILDQELGDTDRDTQRILRSLATTESEITSTVDLFSNRLVDDASAGWVEVKDKEELTREVGQLKDSHIASVRRAGTREIESTRARARSLKDKLEPSLAGARVLVDELRKLKPVVMIVEDDEFARELVSRALDPESWEVVFAADGQEALNQLKRLRPDVILMDIRLPGIDGVSLTHRLKSSPHLADIPVIMMTGDARKETLLSSLAAGAAGYVVKPFTRAVLTEKLDKIFSR